MDTRASDDRPVSHASGLWARRLFGDVIIVGAVVGLLVFLVIRFAATGPDPTPPCPATTLVAESALTPDALLALRCVHQQFPEVTTFGGVREDKLPDHPSGLAVDIMIPDWKQESGKALGSQIAAWLQDHHTELGVHYVIWNGKIWNISRDQEGWRAYPGAGSPDPNVAHRNHVHVTVYGDRGTGPVQPGHWPTRAVDPSGPTADPATPVTSSPTDPTPWCTPSPAAPPSDLDQSPDPGVESLCPAAEAGDCCQSQQR